MPQEKRPHGKLFHVAHPPFGHPPDSGGTRGITSMVRPAFGEQMPLSPNVTPDSGGCPKGGWAIYGMVAYSKCRAAPNPYAS